ncbi:DNA topoisomerase 1 [Sphingobacterium mizutaii NBRC 14946 = DSM 11724]|uniref:DNA topoisomerase 1 n=2 Tax=Sphingobacterium mizutaii TaxID=1010 RepID=A0AAJ4XDI7_9SPHI|nr:type I DNA topoisomerase [Sphingobacterium mizutaii]GEM67447.1 DNA topoisomerase 1 [Sphingobacterium mizutaii NBRC 14946 = DSM 11724]SDL05679.1 DNA topoisomerase-1 [Sphingobacterium mizutaii]SNV50820.1 DNA topoisomerase 1 [Sphingobacterium mizutaii]
MAKNLLIVESPAKAKTIEGYLGKDFLVKSSYGHIRDLVKTDDAIDTEDNFKQKYEVPSDKKALVSELKKLAKSAETVWLASDEDREGEAISWHLFETLGLKDDKTKRIVFHEITKPAILKAIESPRKIDFNLVNAQQARRVLDRLVGFELSPVLWRKVKPSLSAGRVQSVAVRLIVERERDINKFNAEAAFKVVAIFNTGNAKDRFKAELPQRFSTVEEANQFLNDCAKAAFQIKSLETKPSKRTPSAPFTTSTLQQEASRKLGFSVARTMQVAQRLYEAGRITYMRTDSVNLSDTALQGAQAEIINAYGEKYHKLRQYRTKSAGAQEAHEAIRPTYFNDHTIDGDNSEKRLYELIWKRSIASQMSEAEFEKTTAKISISTRSEDLVATGEIMKFDGFLKVYFESSDDDNDEIDLDNSDNAILPPLSKGQELNLEIMHATERFSRPPARFTEASLVKKLEELGIGRPSTYAPTISTIQNRGYVVKEDRDGKERAYKVLTLNGGQVTSQTKTEITGAERNKMFPTDIGVLVNDFLVQHFKGIVDYHFTAKVEKEFDEIAQGFKEWTDMLSNFYGPFHSEVQNTLDNADRATHERELGVDPVTGKPISVRVGRFGPLVQIGTADDEEKPVFASLRKGQMIETITLEEALELFKLPKKVGEFEGKEMTVAIGRFGPYIRHNSSFYSLPKGLDPLDVEQDQAIQIIEEKRQKDKDKIIKIFDENPEAKIENGRWGPFVRFGKQNLKIPKGVEVEKITYADVLKWAEEDSKSPSAKKAARATKATKTTTKKTTTKKATAKKK